MQTAQKHCSKQCYTLRINEPSALFVIVHVVVAVVIVGMMCDSPMTVRARVCGFPLLLHF